MTVALPLTLAGVSNSPHCNATRAIHVPSTPWPPRANCPPGWWTTISHSPAPSDEMRSAAGQVRPHWQHLLDALRTLGPAALEERRREARRLIRDNGVTYNLHGDPQGMSRPWDLDLLPVLIRSDEWAALERGLMQRAELLNLVLLDLYGSRETIRKGLLPGAMIDAYPGYLLPCHGIRVAADHPLVQYAADVTRTPDGAWRVVGDRTQSPSGGGYALENRVVLSRVLPSLFRNSHVHRLAGFYRTMRRTLMLPAGPPARGSCPGRGADPWAAQCRPLRARLPGDVCRLCPGWCRGATSRCATVPCGCAPWGGWSASTPCCGGLGGQLLVRSSGIARGVSPRRAWAAAGGARRQPQRGQCPGQRGLGAPGAHGRISRRWPKR